MNKLIYHYTNTVGLQGIFENDCLWATDHRFLNDRSEIKVFSEWLKNILKLPTNEYNTEVFYDSVTTEVSGFLVFIMSFCGNESNDLLSQWRGYGGEGGYAIGFNYEMLDELVMSESIFGIQMLEKLLYIKPTNSVDEVKEILSDIDCEAVHEIDKILAIAKLPTNAVSHSNNDWEILIKNMFKFKHSGFKEEDEHRMLFAGSVTDKEVQKKIQFKTGSFKPYIEILSGKVIQCIKKIIVGPSIDMHLRERAVKLFIKSKGYNIEVERSKIPYMG